MKKNNIKYIAVLAGVLAFGSCKNQLDVQNPNNPTPASVATETGVVGLAQGSIYLNGFTPAGDKYYDGVIGSFLNGVLGFHELMGDIIGAEAANAYLNQVGCPNTVTLDNGSTVANPNAPSTFNAFIRAVNANGQQGGNPAFHEWALMYQLNNAANNILSLVDKTTFVTASENKKNTLKAWAYFWKGYAYMHIGSMYYAGIINDTPGATNGKYVSKEAMITESNANFDKAVTILNGLSGNTDYSDMLTKLIPDFFQTGKGGVLTTTEWIHNINTLKARNILVNTTSAAMTAAQWGQIATLTANGVTATDHVFTVRANAAGDLFSAKDFNVGNKAWGPNPSGGTFKISERLIQDFNTGDARLAQNFKKGTTWIGNSDRGNAFNTRYSVVDGGAGASGVYTYVNRTAGAGEFIIAGSYEENELMKAEAKLMTGDVAGAAAGIDNVRNYQGAGLAATASTDKAAVMTELMKERRTSLAFRGLSFYDARRWEVITNGRKNAVVVDKLGNVNTKATINYGYLDYWDVPDNELAYNPAASGSAPTKNPK